MSSDNVAEYKMTKPGKSHAIFRRWYLRHKKTENARTRNRNLEYKLETIALLGGKCVKCGILDFRVLQIDHIKAGGTAERRKIPASTYNNLKMVRQDIADGTDKYQLLCANCNWIKRHEMCESRRFQHEA